MPRLKVRNRETGQVDTVDWKDTTRKPTRSEIMQLLQQDKGVARPAPRDPLKFRPMTTPNAPKPSMFSQVVDTMWGGENSALPSVRGLTRPALPEIKKEQFKVETDPNSDYFDPEGVMSPEGFLGAYDFARSSSSAVGAASDWATGKIAKPILGYAARKAAPYVERARGMFGGAAKAAEEVLPAVESAIPAVKKPQLQIPERASSLSRYTVDEKGIASDLSRPYSRVEKPFDPRSATGPSGITDPSTGLVKQGRVRGKFVKHEVMPPPTVLDHELPVVDMPAEITAAYPPDIVPRKAGERVKSPAGLSDRQQMDWMRETEGISTHNKQNYQLSPTDSRVRGGSTSVEYVGAPETGTRVGTSSEAAAASRRQAAIDRAAKALKKEAKVNPNPKVQRAAGEVKGYTAKRKSGLAADKGYPGKGSKATAEFAYHSPDADGNYVATYTLRGGSNPGSSVSADTLKKMGVDIPHTPPVVRNPELEDWGNHLPDVESPTVYHGTQKNVTGDFDPSKGTEGLFSGMTHFAETSEGAGRYANGIAAGGPKTAGRFTGFRGELPKGTPEGVRPNIIPAKIGSKRPLDLTKPISESDMETIANALPEGEPRERVRELWKMHSRDKSAGADFGTNVLAQPDILDNAAIRAKLPYDAYRYSAHGESNWAVPKGTEIKSPYGSTLQKGGIPDVNEGPREFFSSAGGASDRNLGRSVSGDVEPWSGMSNDTSLPPVGAPGAKPPKPPITLEKASLFTPGGRKRISAEAVDTLNVPRAVMASVDLSAPLRQGATMIHKKEFWKALPDMVKSMSSEDAFKALQQEIASRPNAARYKKAKLGLSDMEGVGNREELFMSKAAEKIPVLGKLVRASGRGYVGFLNKMRADVFDSLLHTAQKSGAETTDKAIAKFINDATGRGDLGKAERYVPALNAAFFSPRLMASRVNLLNPMTYVKADPFVRKEYLKSMAAFGGTVSSVLGLAKLAGADVEVDPRSSDFAKIKVGNVRLDIGAGFQQYLRAGAQIAPEFMGGNRRKDLETGKMKKLGGEFGQKSRLDVIQEFAESKASPIASLLITMAKDRTFAGEKPQFFPDVSRINRKGAGVIGEEFSKSELTRRLTPMIAQDLVDLYKEDPDSMWMAAPSVFGTSIQVHKKRTTGKRPN